MSDYRQYEPWKMTRPKAEERPAANPYKGTEDHEGETVSEAAREELTEEDMDYAESHIHALIVEGRTVLPNGKCYMFLDDGNLEILDGMDRSIILDQMDAALISGYMSELRSAAQLRELASAIVEGRG